MDKRRNIIKRWGGRGAKLALVVAGIAALAYWLRFSPVAVETHRVKRGPIVAEVLGTGTLEARVQAAVSPKISGRIIGMLADQGDRVARGAALVTLDDEELQQQVAIARANLEAAGAKVERLVVDRKRTESILTYETSRYRRTRSLYDRNNASLEDLDDATQALRVAEAGLSSAEAAITEGRKEVIAAEESLKFQQARLADATLTAPFDGLIVRRPRDPGDVVVPGRPVLALIDTSELWISAWVDETEMARLQPEQPARVVFRSEPGRSYPGRVARLGREADRETREFIVDVRVLELPANWAVGQRAEVYIETDRKGSALLIPARFVVRQGEAAGVFVEDGGRAAWRPIGTGLRDAEFVEVVEGLKEGETVAVAADPRATLEDGRRIQRP